MRRQVLLRVFILQNTFDSVENVSKARPPAVIWIFKTVIRAIAGFLDDSIDV
jgi:hypothetical protein